VCFLILINIIWLNNMILIVKMAMVIKMVKVIIVFEMSGSSDGRRRRNLGRGDDDKVRA